MNARDEIEYRLGLSAGFLQEAEQDLGLGRWRSCVDNAQLSIENAGKSVLALFGAPPRTHDPAKEVAALLRQKDLPDDVRAALQALLPDLMALGPREHFLTDYGDETSYTLPWALFKKDSATDALAAARRALETAREVAERMRT